MTESRLRGPRQVHMVDSPEAYRQMAREFGARTGLFIGLTENAGLAEAYVSHDRWVIDCVCGNGPSCAPDWPEAVCLECGRVWTPVFPRSWIRIEATLTERTHVRTRNWHLGETVLDLEAETEAQR